MRCLLIHQAFASPDEPGGTRHYEFARHAARRGHSFTIVASDLSYLTGHSTLQRRGLVTEQDFGGVRVLRVYTYPSLHKSFVWRVVSFVSFMLTSLWAALRVGPVDVVMGTSPPIFQAVSAWLIAFLRRRPFLLEVRDLWPEFAIGMGVLRNPLLITLSRRLESFLYARATRLLVNSPAYRDYLIDRGISPRKVSLIPNGVDPDMFDPEDKGEEVRDEFNLDGRFVVTYAGALGLANDIPTLLRAAERLLPEEDIHFLIVGDGKERTSLEALAEQLKLRNVTFIDARPKSQVPALLAASDAGLAILQDIPMFRTTYPNKVFDYMAAGRPTVLAIAGVIQQVVESAQGGVCVPPGDEDSLAQVILRLSRDTASAQAMGRSARSYVVEHFNRHRQADQFVNLLERLALRGKK